MTYHHNYHASEVQSFIHFFCEEVMFAEIKNSAM